MNGTVEAIGPRVKAIRQQRGMSIDALAAQAGMSKSGIWEIEQGKDPRASSLLRLADALGVTPGAFFGDAMPANITQAEIDMVRAMRAAGIAMRRAYE